MPQSGRSALKKCSLLVAIKKLSSHASVGFLNGIEFNPALTDARFLQ
jgi:hypothetical protein